jgi:hypothetical protein
MWGVLAVSVGLAALVSAHRRNALRIQLRQSQTIKHVGISMPADWEITPDRNELAPTVLTAQPSDEEFLNLTVTLEPLPQHLSPSEVALPRNAGRVGRQQVSQEPIEMAGHPGILVSYAQKISPRGIPQMADFDVSTKNIIAATVLPSGRALAIRLIDLGEPEATDLDLVRRMAASIKVENEPAMQSVRRVKLSGDIEVTVPDNFDLVQPTDPQVTERSLRATKSGVWRNISLLPGVLIGREGASAIVTMLSAYGPEWAGATASEQSPGHWRIDRPGGASAGVASSQAYVLADASGAAVIAVFTASAAADADNAWIEPAWRQISAGVTFPGADRTEAMLAAGDTEAARLKALGLAQLLPATRDEAWWLLALGAPDRAFGWVHESPATGGGKLERRLRFPENYIEQVSCDFGASQTLDLYRSMLDCSIAREGQHSAEPQFERYLKSMVRLKQDQLELNVRPQEGTPLAATIETPRAFVPGALLAQITGKLQVDQPMILRTDMAMSCLGARISAPLTLIVRREKDVKRSEEGDASVTLRCISIEVAGSGALSRWYHLPDGALERVEYDQGVTQLRRDSEEISSEFARMPAMKP